MNLNFGPRGILQIDDAHIVYRNFAGVGDKYNCEGDRNFALDIPDEEIADALLADKNQYGVAWNVKIKPNREEGEPPFITLPVKVKFNGRGPKVIVQSGSRTIKLNENTVGTIDQMDIESVDLDIRPYDDVVQDKPFRAAYLQSIWIRQRVDRFDERMAEEEFPEDE